MDNLVQYDWPGNIRELRNVLERSVITSTGRVLSSPEGLQQRKTGKTQACSGPQLRTLEEVERQHILKVLDQAGWRVSGPDGAAQILGINPSTLRFRMKKLHIKRLN
jgi:formate hydrogenlyase transcriptional activator